MNRRLTRAREVVKSLNIDGVLIWKLINVRYLSGFTGTEGACLITPDQALFLTDSRYTVQAGEQVTPNGFTVVQTKEKIPGIAATAKEIKKLKRMAYEDEVLSVAVHGLLDKAVGDIELEPVGDRIESLRVIKDEEEIELIKQAVRVQEEAMEAILRLIKPGKVENDIAFELEMEMRRLGASTVSFDTIVASGPRGAMPHGVAADKKIEAGELVVIDWGCIRQGYCSDQTLTVSVGEPSDPDAKKVFEIVRQAQAAGIEAIKPGVRMADVDKAARDVIEQAGYGEFFGHGTGHSLGLEIHEEPRANSISKETAEVGMVFTVEPGIYLADRFGVRLEDIIVVRENGAECLTTMHKNWRQLD